MSGLGKVGSVGKVNGVGKAGLGKSRLAAAGLCCYKGPATLT